MRHSIYGCVFCSVPLLFVYLRMHISSNASSIVGVPFDSVGSLRTTLILRTTCMRSAIIGVLAVWRYYKPKTKNSPTRVVL